jgi:L-ascorbate metabolism protein UlaG (beta-lactamase superfamily)
MKPNNFDGKRFYLDGFRVDGGPLELLKWQFNNQRTAWPRRVENTKFDPPPPRIQGDSLCYTWIGQATTLIQIAGLNILTDPFFSERASPLQWAGPRRVRSPGLAIDQLPDIDVILVSHNHYDHMDLPALRQLAARFNATVLTPLGNGARIARAGRSFHVSELNWNDSVKLRNASFTLTPAYHWSKRTMFDRNKALWGAFVIETRAGIIYFGADTGYGDGATFRDIRRHFGPPRLSILPIGAYEPRWFMQPQHMNPAEAVQAHLDLESATTAAIHHETIQLTDEAIDAPRRDLAKALRNRGINSTRFVCPEVGEVLRIS